MLRLLWILSIVSLLASCAGGDAIDRQRPVPQQEDDSGVIGDVGPPRERAKAHAELAAAYFEQGNMGVALEEARIAIQADPAYAPGYTILGLVHMDLKENDLAESAFQRALRIAPNDPDANHNYGWFLCQSSREDVSLKYFLTAIRNPLYNAPAKSYTVAGVCAARRGNDRDAIEYLERALRLDAANLAATINLAQLRYRRGEYDQARLLINAFNRSIEPTAESLWLSVRIERRVGEKEVELRMAELLRRRFPGSPEFQAMQRGQFE